jgi:hypothetical protein
MTEEPQPLPSAEEIEERLVPKTAAWDLDQSSAAVEKQWAQRVQKEQASQAQGDQQAGQSQGDQESQEQPKDDDKK